MRPPTWWHSLGALVRSTVHQQRRAPIVWGIGLGAMCALMVGLWPSIEDSIGQLMKNYPPEIKDAFGIKDLNSVEKYVDAEMLSLIVPLALALFAERAATRSTVTAEDRGYLSSLLSLPLSRRVLVLGSFLSTAIVVAVILVVMWALTWITGIAVGTGISATTLGAGFANVWPICMAFAGLAVLAAGVFHRPATVTAIAGGTLVAMYVIDIVGKISEPFEPVRVVSAFRYYGSAIQDGLDLGHVALLTISAIVLAVIGAELFERRDLN